MFDKSLHQFQMRAGFIEDYAITRLVLTITKP